MGLGVINSKNIERAILNIKEIIFYRKHYNIMYLGRYKIGRVLIYIQIIFRNMIYKNYLIPAQPVEGIKVVKLI